MIEKMAVLLKDKINTIPGCNCLKVNEKIYGIYANRRVKWSDTGRKWGYFHLKKDYLRIDVDFPVRAFESAELSNMFNLPFIKELQPNVKEDYKKTGLYKRTCEKYDTVVIIVYPEDMSQSTFLDKMQTLDKISRVTCV